MKIKIDSFGDHFNPLLGNGAIWTSLSNGNHKCRLCNKNFRCLIACTLLCVVVGGGGRLNCKFLGKSPQVHFSFNYKRMT